MLKDDEHEGIELSSPGVERMRGKYICSLEIEISGAEKVKRLTDIICKKDK